MLGLTPSCPTEHLKSVSCLHSSPTQPQTAPAVNTEHEISVLKAAILQHGKPTADGKTVVTYGVLFDKTADTLEALNGTLRAAKRQKKVAFAAELLMMPKDKDTEVTWIE